MRSYSVLVVEFLIKISRVLPPIVRARHVTSHILSIQVHPQYFECSRENYRKYFNRYRLVHPKSIAPPKIIIIGSVNDDRKLIWLFWVLGGWSRLAARKRYKSDLDSLTAIIESNRHKHGKWGPKYTIITNNKITQVQFPIQCFQLRMTSQRKNGDVTNLLKLLKS